MCKRPIDAVAADSPSKPTKPRKILMSPRIYATHIGDDGSSSSEEDTVRRDPSSPRTKHHVRHIVTQHNYHDHAADPVDGSIDGPRKHQGRGGVITAFPVKLFEMLESVDKENLSHIVSWQPHGRCFVVHDVKAFLTILPRFFKMSKISSFQRQLNLYGFQRLTAGVDKGGYYHELFLRGRPDLADKMQRIKVKGTGVRAKANPTEEPNFYLYPSVDDKASKVTPTTTTSSSEITSDDQEVEVPTTVPPSSGFVGALTTIIKPITVREEVCSAQVIFPLPKDNDCMEFSFEFVPCQENSVSFDKLLDEMFSHNQELDFNDLLERATI